MRTSELNRMKSHLEEMVAKRTKELSNAKNEAEQAEKAKTIFLANISHELRTPLHSILNFADIGIDSTEDTPKSEITEYFDKIKQSGKGLMTLINHILYITNFDRGEVNTVISNINLTKTIANTIEKIEDRNIEKKIDFILKTDKGPCTIEADKEQMEDLFFNIFDNCINYCPYFSKVEIEISNFGKTLDINVSDQGPGIPSKEVENVFDTFTLSSATSNGAGGRGLGLPICKEIVKLHQGIIKVKRNKWSGATINIILPVQQSLDLDNANNRS